MNTGIPIDERLEYSVITYIDDSNAARFIPSPLDPSISCLVNEFTRAITYFLRDLKLLMTLNTTKYMHTISLLTSCHNNIMKERKMQQLNPTIYQDPEAIPNRESDFKIKYVVPFINGVFKTDKLSVNWDLPLKLYENSDMSLLRRETPDIVFKTLDGNELGIAEIKPFNARVTDVENDVVRLAEITKRMLHKRILNAKSTKEWITFAIMFNGSKIDYYITEFRQSPTTSSSTSEASTYSFSLIHSSLLPTLPNTYTHMYQSLEFLCFYKNMMEASVVNDSEIEKPYLYKNYCNIFKPTVTLLKLDDDESLSPHMS
ncbi:hypothetical protein BD408DRAFT_364973 [Parasitella parasitica]|nr:hypothetical protein BD408DRAFT_364973 [Parasitella parasitica]